MSCDVSPCACDTWLISPGWGHLNSYLAQGGGNLNTNFPKIQMVGGLPGGGMLKLCKFENLESKLFFLNFERENENKLVDNSFTEISQMS